MNHSSQSTFSNNHIEEATEYNLDDFFRSELFVAVQTSGIFTDSKTFADAVPKHGWQKAASEYLECKEQAGFLLSSFVAEYFELPSEIHQQNSTAEPAYTMEQTITSLWSVLHRNPDAPRADSLLALQHSYTVPGGRFREIYYWDSYFTSLGLLQAGRVEDVQSLIENFIDLQQRIGLIPNGNRWYYRTRSQPPVLSLLVAKLLQHKTLAPSVYQKYMMAVEREYQFWMNGGEQLEFGAFERVVKMPCGRLLNRYFDSDPSPRAESYLEDIELADSLSIEDNANFYRNIRAACESGWDFSSRWLARGSSLGSIATTEIIPVDLNSLLCSVERTLSEFYREQGDKNRAKAYQLAMENRKGAIEEYCWCEVSGFYFDYWFEQHKRSDVFSLAGLWPLYLKLADRAKSAKVASVIERKFLQHGGLLTTLNTSQQQWDSPNGWAPLHWIAIQGLYQAGEKNLAKKIAIRWIDNVRAVYDSTGKFMEKYNVINLDKIADGGEYQVQEGFGWTNGVTIALIDWLATTES